MLVTFKTDHHAGITMFGDVALDMLKRMGHSPTIPGAIAAEKVPEALSRLTSSIETIKELLPDEDEDQDEPSVSTGHRALPLIDLLTAAAAAEDTVMWEEASFYN